MRSSLLLLLIVSLSVAPATLPTEAALRAQDVAAPARFAAVRDRVARAIERGAAPAVAVAVLDDREVVWAEGFGKADLARDRPATADTIFRLASISKPFTATALMVLVERGALDLDAPVDRYLEPPGVIAYRGGAADITLRRLANHTGGLPTHWSFFYEGTTAPPRAETIRAYGFAAFAPGTRTNYSNLGFGILDHVVARTSGQSFRDFLVAEVLDPLGMDHTDLGVRPGREDAAAVSYLRDVAGRFVPVVDYGFDHDGASAVRSSARDLMRFALLQIDEGTAAGRPLLRPATARAMRERHGRRAGSPYGVGWSVGEVQGTIALSHSGGMPGVATLLQVFPERRAAVAVLTNCGNRDVVDRTSRAIVDVLLGAPRRPPDAADPAAASDARRTGPPPAGCWRGHVAHPDGPVPVELTVTDGGEAKLRLGRREVDTFQRAELAADQISLHFRALLRTTRAFHGTPALELELVRDSGGDGNGWQGVLYAVGDATFRLPHWVELAPATEKAPGTLRVVSYNVLVGFSDHAVGTPYLPGVQRRAAIRSWLAAEAPDVVALQELNGFSDDRLRAEAATWDHPHAVVLKESGFPTGLTSRWPIEVVERRLAGLHHGLLHCRTAGIDFVVVHLVPQPGIERKTREVEQVLTMYEAARSAGRPVVLLGDFNAVSPADVDRFSAAALERYARWQYATENGRPVATPIAKVLDSGAVDVLCRHREGDLELPLPRIDFVFASPDLAALSRACRWLPDEELLRRSDHPPVVADFEWTPPEAATSGR